MPVFCRRASRRRFLRACGPALATLVGLAGASQTHAGTYLPIGTFGYNFDGVAEAPPATVTTDGTFDGALEDGYVLYAHRYGGRGLPDDGKIVRPGRAYQLQPYDRKNALRLDIGTSADLVLDAPAVLSAVSLLGFATMGAGTADVRVHFGDGTEQAFDGVSVPDWFDGDNAVLAGFDRLKRSSATPEDVGPQDPRMYAFDFMLVQRCGVGDLKPVERISIENTGDGWVPVSLSFMAVSAQTVGEAIRISGPRIVPVLQVSQLTQALSGGTWSSSDPGVATLFPIGDGLSANVAALRPGTATVTYSCGPGQESTRRIVVVAADSIFYDDFDA